MKLFSKQLSTIHKNQEILSSANEDVSNYPQLHQFLFVVGVEGDVKEVYFQMCIISLTDCLSMLVIVIRAISTPYFHNDPPRGSDVIVSF